MKKSLLYKLLVVVVILVVGIWFVFAGNDESALVNDEHKKLIDFIKTHNGVADFDVEALNYNDLSTITVTEKGKTFKVVTRKDKISIEKCSTCHNGVETTFNKSSFERKNHWDIQNPHGKAENINCTTCHNRDNLDLLNVGTEKTVDFNQSYSLCSTCHFGQYNDWLGGAHGKRLVGWTGDRIKQNCTGCHNPHSPLFEKRRPKIMSPVLE